MTILARCNGTVLVEVGTRVGVTEQSGGWLGTAIFIAALAATICIGGGVGLAVTTSAMAGIAIAGLGFGALASTMLLVRARRASRAQALPAPWLVFDRATRVVSDRTGAALCSFDECRIERVFQLASSSRALAVYCPEKLVVARGTPFGDDVDSLMAALEHVLRSEVVIDAAANVTGVSASPRSIGP